MSSAIRLPLYSPTLFNHRPALPYAQQCNIAIHVKCNSSPAVQPYIVQPQTCSPLCSAVQHCNTCQVQFVSRCTALHCSTTDLLSPMLSSATLQYMSSAIRLPLYSPTLFNHRPALPYAQQ